MVLNKIKNRKNEKGFTIVELLVVIVVIAILAAITIVAYSGITAKANATRAQTNTANTQKVGEAFNADCGYYPAVTTDFANGCTANGNIPSSKEPTGITISIGATGTGGTATAAGTPTASVSSTALTNIKLNNGTTNVAYDCLITCTNSTGGRLSYWNVSTQSIVAVYLGAANSTSAFVSPAS